MNLSKPTDVKSVIIHATDAPSAEVLGNRLVSHRLNGVVESVATDEKTGITTVNIKANAYDERTAQEAWTASKAEPTKETAVVAGDAAKKPDDMDKATDPPMDPPAE